MRCASWKCAAVFKRPVRKTIPGRIAGPGTDNPGAGGKQMSVPEWNVPLRKLRFCIMLDYIVTKGKQQKLRQKIL